MYMNKHKNFCDHSMILWEMAGDLLTSGLSTKENNQLYDSLGPNVNFFIIV